MTEIDQLYARKEFLLERIQLNRTYIMQHECCDGAGEWRKAKPYKDENNMLMTWLGEVQDSIDTILKGEQQ